MWQSLMRGVEQSIVGGIRCDWKKFRELLPLLFSLFTKGKLFQVCVRSVVLYGSDTWAVKEVNLERNDMMARWMCHVTLKDIMSSDELINRLGW